MHVNSNGVDDARDAVDESFQGATALNQTSATLPVQSAQFTVEDLIQATVRAMVLHDQATGSGTRCNDAPSTSPQVQVRSFTNKEIAALLAEFSGTGQDVEVWLERITAVQRVYHVPDDVMQVIAVGKLTMQAKQWFQSKVEYITMDWPSLKTEIRKMYSCQVNTVALRKQFESRRWKPNERFSNYYHDKVTLGNNAFVPEAEMIQYIIDGFDNKLMQIQARMMLHEIRCLEDLYKIMNNVVRDEKEVTNPRTNFPKSPAHTKSTLDKTVKVVRCFNCNKEGHKVPDFKTA